LFFISSIIFFSITFVFIKPIFLKIISMFFMTAHLFYHRYGISGLFIKIGLILGQLLILFGFLGLWILHGT
jgi:hypothetical protein